MTHPLWLHQRIALDLAKKRNEFALFFEPGLGKTRTVIEILKHKMSIDNKFLRTLVLCPLSVTSVWRNELLANGFTDNQILLGDGLGVKRIKKIHTALWDTFDKQYLGGRILVINYEGVVLKDVLSIVTQWRPECVIMDESHRLKSYNAKRSKTVFEIAQHAKYRYLLSGTPVLKDAGDLFMPFKILDGGKTFGTNWWIFKNRYFRDANQGWKSSQNYFPKYEIRPEAIKEIAEKIAPASISVRKIDALDLPPLVCQTITTEMSKEQSRVYEDMKKEMISFLDEQKQEAAVATIALTKALRFQQIVSGFVVTNAEEPYVFKENPRLVILKDLLSDLTPNHKVIVWACFKQNYEMIRGVCADLGVGHVELHGSVSGPDRAANLKAFQDNQQVRVMIANQHSGGVGVSMTAASYAIYYSKNFSLEDDVQSEARNHRGGSEIHEKITRIDLVAAGTIDEGVNKSLALKQAIGLEILNGLRK